MDAHERRLRNLEKAIPKKTDNFNASFENLNDAPIDEDDPRLKRGVEEFVNTCRATARMRSVAGLI